MISNVALKSTEAAGNAAAASGESADTGDTGAFDALLTLQSLQDSTVTDLTAQLAGALEGLELPGALDESEDSESDDPENLPDDALSFLASILPLTPKPAPAPDTSQAPAASPVQSAPLSSASGGTTPVVNGETGTTDDLAKAILLGTQTATTDPKQGAASAGAAIDTTSWNSLSGPAEMFAHAPRHATTEKAESASLATHVRDPRWADDLGNRLASMVRTGESSASLQLTPVDLGPLEVQVAVRDNQASVHFGAANAETRALLEASIPRLREMLAAQGFQLMDSSVSHGFARSARHESAGTPRVNEVGESPSVAPTTHITGLLDLYA
jgi:flagellar hook-length control protein FliK